MVKLLLTGSEVVDHGIPEPGKVRDTFGPQLASVVGMLGGICAAQVRIGDSYSEWLEALEDEGPGAEPDGLPGEASGQAFPPTSSSPPEAPGNPEPTTSGGRWLNSAAGS